MSVQADEIRQWISKGDHDLIYLLDLITLFHGVSMPGMGGSMLRNIH